MGRAVALLASERGYPVVLVDRDETQLNVVATEIGSAPHSAFVADVCDRRAMTEAFAASEAKFGPCWALAAVAGVMEAGSALELDDEHVDRMMGVNFRGVVIADQLAASQMQGRTDGGRIVNWGSDAAIGGLPGRAIYAAAKSAVLSLTRSFAVELAPFGITVNAILPGVTDTPMAAHISPAEKTAFATTIPDGRWATPQDMAWWFGVLIADESAHMTGETLLVDGGATARMGR